MFVWPQVSSSLGEYLGMEFLGPSVISFIKNSSIFSIVVEHFILSLTSLIALVDLYP